MSPLFSRLPFVILCALVLAFASLPARAASLDDIAGAYVRLVLRVAQHDEGYLDAYFGPDSWLQEAKAAPGTLDGLKGEAERLLRQVDEIRPDNPPPLLVRRRAFLKSQLQAVNARLEILQGKKFTYRQEAQALFGVWPDLKPLSAYDEALARLKTLAPGEGPLPARIAAVRARFAVPRDRLKVVMQASIDECRRRTRKYITLPGGETFRLEIVSHKPWAAYNWYKGNGQSLIQLNTDYPLTVERVLELACHEGYPGHHTQNTLLQEELVNKRHWVEYTVYPLSSPFFFIAEGIGNFVPELVFPTDERIAFLKKILLPLAGLSPDGAQLLVAVHHAVKALAPASMTISANYLDGKIDRNKAQVQIARYALLTDRQAAQSVDLMTHYRSYGVNYGLGEQVVRSYVMKTKGEKARWQRLKALLSEPWTPAELISAVKGAR